MMPDGGYSRPSAKAGGRFVFGQAHGAVSQPVYIVRTHWSEAGVMNEMPSVDQIWQMIRREAESAAARDTVFSAALSSAILDHPDFAHALAHQIGARLGKDATDRGRFARVADEAFAASRDLIEAASRDLQSIALHDPAMTTLLPPLLNFKGYVALQAWRVSNWLWRGERRDLALMMQSLSSDQLQVSIHPSASIGTSVFLDHATGIIIGAHAVIGDEETILQNVTIGRKNSEPDRAPIIGRGVYLSAGSTIIGNISVGDFAKVGAGAVVEHDVPAGCTAVGVPARLTNCPEPMTQAPLS
jgi:serine O-acetyltransferase